MHYYKTLRFIDDLQDIVTGYNNNYHRSIKEAPSNVNYDNEARISLNQREIPLSNIKDKLSGVNYVRIATKKNVFDKGTTKNWTTEVFKIVSRKKTPTTYIYKLEDLYGEELTSIFYPNELQKAIKKIGPKFIKAKLGRPPKVVEVKKKRGCPPKKIDQSDKSMKKRGRPPKRKRGGPKK